MKKKIRKLIACVLCVSFIAVGVPSVTARAEGPKAPEWVVQVDGSYWLVGTDITARLSYGSLVVNGNGAIPDYFPTTYSQRPWDKLDFNTLSIGSGITEIGSFAFGDKPCIKKVEMYSGTFIKDSTSFHGLSQDVIIRIHGSSSSWKTIGTIQLSSLETIGAYFSKNPCIMDTADAAGIFRCLQYPFMRYVYSADDKDAPWNNKVDITKGIEYSKQAYISKDNDMGLFWQMYAEKVCQGNIYMNCMSQLIGDYVYVGSYNITLLNQNGAVYGTDGPKKYVLNIPKNEQSYFKQFRLIEVGPAGTVFYLDDLDNKIETITFSTAYPTSNYALVYKWDMNKLAPYAAITQ